MGTVIANVTEMLHMKSVVLKIWSSMKQLVIVTILRMLPDAEKNETVDPKLKTNLTSILSMSEYEGQGGNT